MSNQPEPWHGAALRRARLSYLAEVNSAYDEVLHEVHDRIIAVGSVGKADIGALVFWKRLQANTLWARRLLATSDVGVRAVTERAVAAVQDKAATAADAGRRARSVLYELDGFKHGDALASAVLTAIDPARMAVFDRRASASLKALELSFSGGYGGYLALLGQLQSHLDDAEHTWTARDVDLALFWLRDRHIERPQTRDSRDDQ